MTRLKTSSGQFGLIGGICRATSDCILAEEPSPISPTARWKGSLYVLAEPVAERGRGHQAASQAIKEISEAYYACTSTSVTTCLARAIQKANESLFEHNMEVSGHEKVTVGVTCAVVRGKEAFLAQVLPGQIYVVHGGRIRAYPLNPSWDPEASTLPTVARLQALGWAEELTPEFFHSPLASGDIFCLSTSNIGRFLGQEEASDVFLYQEPGDVVEQLYRRVHQQGFKDAHAVVVEIQPVLGRTAAPFFSVAGLKERAGLVAETFRTWGSYIAGETRRAFQRKKPRRRHAAPAKQTRRPPAAPTPQPEMPSLARPKPREPWPKRIQQALRNIVRPQADMPRLAKPRLRIRSTRERRRFIPPALAFAAVAVLAVIVLLVYQSQQARLNAEVDQLIEQAQERLLAAAEATDLAEANGILDEAESLLLEAKEKQRAEVRVEQVRSDLRYQRDQLNDIARFEQLSELADLKTFSTTMGCLERCSFRDLVLIEDTLYVLEQDQSSVFAYTPITGEGGATITLLLQKGMEIQGHRTGQIVAMTRLEWPRGCTPEEPKETWLAVLDADRWLYLHRQGQWKAYALSSESSWENRRVDLEGYEGNIYVLKGEIDQILKFYCNAYELTPERWIRDPRQVPVGEAADMAIDGYIYFLLNNGTVVSLLQGSIEYTISYQDRLYPSTINPSQLFTDPQTDLLYVVDGYGRIIELRKTAEDSFVRQLQGPPDLDLQGLKALVVLEDQDLVFMLAGSVLYRGVLPPLESERSPTPVPAPLP